MPPALFVGENGKKLRSPLFYGFDILHIGHVTRAGDLAAAQVE